MKTLIIRSRRKVASPRRPFQIESIKYRVILIHLRHVGLRDEIVDPKLGDGRGRVSAVPYFYIKAISTRYTISIIQVASIFELLLMMKSRVGYRIYYIRILT